MALTSDNQIMRSCGAWEEVSIWALKRLSPRQASKSDSKKAFSEATNARASDGYEISAIHERYRLTKSGMYRSQTPGLVNNPGRANIRAVCELKGAEAKATWEVEKGFQGVGTPWGLQGGFWTG